MAKKLYTESNIEDIAAAIRAKNGSSATYTTAQMAAAIMAIPTGSDTKLVYGTVSFETAGVHNIQHNLGRRPRVWGLIRQDSTTGLINGVTLGTQELLDAFCFINPISDESPMIQTFFRYNSYSSDVTVDVSSYTIMYILSNFGRGTYNGIDNATEITASPATGVYRYINHNYFAIQAADSGSSSGVNIGFAKTNANYFWFVAG